MHTLVLYLSTSPSLFLLREGKDDLSEQRPQSGGEEPECSPGRERSRCGGGGQVAGNCEEVSRDGSRAQVVGSALEQHFWMNCPVCIPKLEPPEKTGVGNSASFSTKHVLAIRIHTCLLAGRLAEFSFC